MEIGSVDAEISQMLDVTAPLCAKRPNDVGMCVHMQQVESVFESPGEQAPNRSLAQLLAKAAGFAYHCPACAKYLGKVVVRLATAAHSAFGQAEGDDDTGLQNRTRVSIGGRKRHFKGAFRMEISENVIKALKTMNGIILAKPHGVKQLQVWRWMKGRGQARAWAFRRWATGLEGTWCQVEDGARLGKPAREVKTYAVLHAGTGQGCWLMNQVSRGTPALNGGLHFPNTPIETCVFSSFNWGFPPRRPAD